MHHTFFFLTCYIRFYYSSKGFLYYLKSGYTQSVLPFLLPFSCKRTVSKSNISQIDNKTHMQHCQSSVFIR